MANNYLNLYYRNGSIAFLTVFLLVISSNLFAQAPSVSSFTPASGTSGISATVGLAPSISSFTPASGTTGSSVTISGSNFGSTASSNSVYFGAAKATVTAASTTSLTVTVPTGATFSPISVTTTNNVTAYSAKPFVVTYSNGSLTAYNYKRNYLTGPTKDTFQVKNTTLADLDLDGKIDLIANNFHGQTLAIFKNNSNLSGEVYNLSLGTRVDYPTEANPSNVAVGDLDGDGKLDIVIPNYGNASITVRKNTSTVGSISLGTAQKFTTGTGPRIAAVVDIDGDGRLDIAVVNEQSSTISFFRNTTVSGTISFASKIDVSTYSSNPRDLRFGDFDGDGKTDFVTSDFGSGSVTFFRNTSTSGSISVSYNSSYYLGGSPRSATIADFNEDGKLDIAVANYSSSSAQIVKNQSTSGSFSFTSGSTISNLTNAYGVTAGDIDGDGKVDLAVAHNTSTGGFSVLKNVSTNSSISFNTQTYYSTSDGTTFVTIGDLDGDSSPELLASNYFVNLVTILSQGATTLPLDLLTFNGSIENNLVKLEWQTAKETNLSRFVIEHSSNETFDSVAVALPGKTTYNLYINKLYNGNNYYRLKIVNLDGTVTYSNVITLSLDLATSKKGLIAFPNPSHSNVTLQYPDSDNKAVINIINVSGKTEMRIPAQSTQTTVDISNLSPGLYFVQWRNGKKQFSQKLIKQ